MAVLFRRLTEHMQRFDGLFSSALLKSKILYITQGYLHFSHPVLHKCWSLQFIEWCLFSAYISEYPGFQRIFFLIDNEAALKQKKAARRKKILLLKFYYFIIFFSSALCASLTRLRREPSVSIRKKYPLEPRVISERF